jgi:hypothetical protein
MEPHEAHDVAAWGIRLDLLRSRSDPHKPRWVGVQWQEPLGDEPLEDRLGGGGPPPW